MPPPARGEGELGLYHYGARWYDASQKRFIQPDPIVPEPGNSQALNRYSYVLNNPLKYSDPNGHWVETALDIAGLAFDIYQIRQEGWTTVNTIALVVDVVCLVAPVAAGGGVAVRALAHGDDVADAVRVATQVDNVADAASAASRAADAASVARHLDDFQHAGQFGIRPVGELRGLGELADLRRVAGEQVDVHHLIEKRFVDNLGLASDADIPGVVLTRAEHSAFTRKWRDIIGYRGDLRERTTANADPQVIWGAAQRVYADYPELLEAVRQFLGR